MTTPSPAVGVRGTWTGSRSLPPSAAVPRPRARSRSAHKAPLAWLPWVLLATLLTLLALLLLLGRLAGSGEGAQVAGAAASASGDVAAHAPHGASDRATTVRLGA